MTTGQVIAPLLIVERVANRTALTSDSIVTGNVGTFRTRSRGESTGGSYARSGGQPMCSADSHGKGTGEVGAVAETAVDPQDSRV